jgi:sec-independent protein translocase protein TatC
MKSRKKVNKLKRFTLEEHLFELKSRLIKVVLFFFIITLITFQYSWDIFAIISKPLLKLTANENSFYFIYTKLTEGFFTELKIALVFSIFFTLPVFSFQLYKFLAPSLYQYERRVILPYLIFPPLLFSLGVALVYFVVMPVTWKFFLSFQNLNPEIGVPIRLEAKISEYLSLVLELFIGFGIAFQLPIFLIMLTKLNIVTTEQLVKFRRHSIVVIFIASAVLTPPDVFSQITLALPLMLLYEISIFCCKQVN